MGLGTVRDKFFPFLPKKNPRLVGFIESLGDALTRYSETPRAIYSGNN
jgi:hypothetical protein